MQKAEASPEEIAEFEEHLATIENTMSVRSTKSKAASVAGSLDLPRKITNRTITTPENQ